MIRRIPFIIVLILIATNCSNITKQEFSLTIKHYAGGPGLTVIYYLNDSSLDVGTNCDLADCQEKIVYKRTFTKNENDSIYKFINSLQLDTLKSSYKTEGIMDGLFTNLSFRKGFFRSHSSTFDNFKTPVTDTLFKFIDNLIQMKKYRFYSWGQDE
ncbi:MAG TPA: hypothetical protein VHZ50_13665 [Puia sp.]|jgi:hypothetical protein|nr:hypothetical protein [Puia sp.]